MSLCVRDVMRPAPKTVDPDETLPDLQRALLEQEVSGFPVVEDGKLVGVVSRSDVVRQLSVEQTLGEVISDYYRDSSGQPVTEAQSLDTVAQHVGRRMESLRVRDVMIPGVIVAAPDEPLREAARRLIDRDIHRLPVVEDGKLVGILTSTDLVRLFAEDRVAPR